MSLSLNIFEKALLEGLTSKELTDVTSQNIYTIPSGPGSLYQMNPGKFLPVLQGYNPRNPNNNNAILVPYVYGEAADGFDETKYLYMFSIKDFDKEESYLLSSSFFSNSISPDLIFDSNANIYSASIYATSWQNVLNPPSGPGNSPGPNMMYDVIQNIKTNTTFSFFNPLLSSQPTSVYEIKKDGGNDQIYQQITATIPSDRNSETVIGIQKSYTQIFNNFAYLPQDLSNYPIYIPSMFFQYFLYKASENDGWHIIYNPVHRQSYYNFWSQTNYAANTMGSKITDIHMINYGNIFKTTVAKESTESYFIDPVCTCVTPLAIKYPNTDQNTKPNYVGPYIFGYTDDSSFFEDINTNLYYYSLYNFLTNENKYSYDTKYDIVIEKSLYDSDFNMDQLSKCYSSCSNNKQTIIQSPEPYKYSLPIIKLTYYIDNNKSQSINTLPLWGKMSFINYVNSRAYSQNGTSTDQKFICDISSITQQICEVIFDSASGINITSDAQINNQCINGGLPIIPDKPGVPSHSNNTAIIIIIVLSVLLGLFVIFLLVSYKSKNKSIKK